MQRWLLGAHSTNLSSLQSDQAIPLAAQDQFTAVPDKLARLINETAST